MSQIEKFSKPAPREKSIYSDTSSIKALEYKRKFQVVLPEE